MRMKAWLLCSALCLLTATAPAAEVLWYGGELDFESGLCSGSGFVRDSNVYDDFEVVRRPIELTALFGHFGVFSGTFQVGEIQYEIRSSISAGNGGSILAQGVIGASQIDRGPWGQGYYYQITTEPLSVFLPAGTYWMSIAPITKGEPTFALTTRGVNGVGIPIGNGNAFWNAPWFGAHFVPAEEVMGGDRNWDFSFGIIGTIVPAPGAFLVLLSGLLFRCRALRD